MTKTYTFYDDSDYHQPGCSCCEGFLMEAYNSSDTDSNFGTASCLEDCYVHAIITEAQKQGVDLYVNDDSLWEQPLKSLKVIAKELGIVVEIIS